MAHYSPDKSICTAATVESFRRKPLCGNLSKVLCIGPLFPLFEAHGIYTTHQLIGKYLKLKSDINTTRADDDQAFHEYLISKSIPKNHIGSIVRSISEKVDLMFPYDYGQDEKVGEKQFLDFFEKYNDIEYNDSDDKNV